MTKDNLPWQTAIQPARQCKRHWDLVSCGCASSMPGVDGPEEVAYPVELV